MFRKNLVLVIYDVSDNKKREKLVKCLKSYGVRVQKSSFECLLSKKLYKKMVKESNKIIDKKTDSLRIYKMNNENKILNYGIGKNIDKDNIKIF